MKIDRLKNLKINLCHLFSVNDEEYMTDIHTYNFINRMAQVLYVQLDRGDILITTKGQISVGTGDDDGC